MNWRVMGPVLGAVLVAAIVFSLWPGGEAALSREPPVPAPTPTQPTAAPTPAPSPRPAQPAPAPVAAAPTPEPAPERPAGFPGTLDDEPDPAQLAALGLTLADREPEDGGVLHPVTPQGIRDAVHAAQPEIKECYDAWLQQNPNLGGRVRLTFDIAEIPGRNRAKVMDIDVPPDAGIGNLAFEGCVKNVFKSLRFERPEDGELKVTYPLVFSKDGPPRKAP